MDHGHYSYRARTSGGGDGTLLAFVVLFLEHWDAEPAADSMRDPRFVGEFGSFTPDYRSWTQREYGLRVGIFRVLDALQACGLRFGVAANAHAVQRLPQLVHRLQQTGCEWVAHGLSSTRLMHSRMPQQEQAAHIQTSLDALHAATGQHPAGWLSQDWGTTPQTFSLLASKGLRYCLDWCNDDEPYRLRTSPPLWAVPLSAEWDDVQCQWLRHLSPRQHAGLALQAFDRLSQECRQSGRCAVFGLPLHPWVCGMSSRIGALKDLLAQLRAREGARWVLPGEIPELMSRRNLDAA